MPGDQAPTAVTVGDFILVGAGKKERKSAKVLERRLARLDEFEAKEHAGGLAGAIAGQSKDSGDGRDVKQLEAELDWVKNNDLGDEAVARAMAKVAAKKAAAQGAPTVAKAQRSVRDLKAKLKGAIEKEIGAQRVWAEAAERVTMVADDLAKAEKLEKEAISARQEELGLGQPVADTKPKIIVDEVMAGKVSFELVLGQDLDLSGLDVSSEDAEEVEKRKQTLVDLFSKSITEAFQPLAENIKRAKEDTARLRERLEAKKRRTTDDSDVHQGVGGGGGSPGSAASPAGASMPAAEGASQERSNVEVDGRTASIAVDVVGLGPGTSGAGGSRREADVTKQFEAVMGAARGKLDAKGQGV